MADRVIIAGARRGGKIVSVSELRQMAGRAGRENDKSGEVRFVVSDDDSGISDNVFEHGNAHVSSSLYDYELLANVILPDIAARNVYDYKSADIWLRRSLCDSPPIEKAIKLLYNVNAIEGENFTTTTIGDCAVNYYFHPADVYAWYCNFESLFELGLENDEVGPAWAIGNVYHDKITGDVGKERREILSECRSRTPFALDIMEGNLINIVTWWYLMGGPSPGNIRFACLERRREVGRFMSVLRRLDQDFGWNRGDFIDDLELRIKRGIKPDSISLCKWGFNKSQAEFLHSMDVYNVYDIAKSLNTVRSEIDNDNFRQKVEDIARQVGSESG